MTSNPSTFTLVTGASAGLGKAFALECARQGHNLILVALPGRNLSRLGEALERDFGVEVVAYETDLCHADQISSMVSHLLGHYAIAGLINNAGMGGTAPLVDTPADTITRILQLNVEATTMLTRLLLPELLRHRQAFILNIASMAAFTPMAYKSVYSATKNYICFFSRALREELRSTGITVSILYPGPILTNFSASRRIIAQGALGRIGLLSCERIAAVALRQKEAGLEKIIPGFWNKLNYGLMQIVPANWRMRLLAAVFRRESKIG